jgi:hypothetical protein
MPQRGDGVPRASDEGQIRQFIVLLRTGLERPRNWRRLRTRNPRVISGPGKRASTPAKRPKLRLGPRPMACEQYIAPTRAQRVALCE